MTSISLLNVYDIVLNLPHRLGQLIDPMLLIQSIIVIITSIDAEKLELMPR